MTWSYQWQVLGYTVFLDEGRWLSVLSSDAFCSIVIFLLRKIHSIKVLVGGWIVYVEGGRVLRVGHFVCVCWSLLVAMYVR